MVFTDDYWETNQLTLESEGLPYFHFAWGGLAPKIIYDYMNTFDGNGQYGFLAMKNSEKAQSGKIDVKGQGLKLCFLISVNKFDLYLANKHGCASE